MIAAASEANGSLLSKTGGQPLFLFSYCFICKSIMLNSRSDLLLLLLSYLEGEMLILVSVR